jgi:phosphate starvation-inducible protein PhoH
MGKKITKPSFLETPKKTFDTKEMSKLHSKMDSFQLDYFNALQQFNIVTVDSPSGTGKTTIAVMAGLQLLDEGKVNKLVYLRLPSSRAMKQGFMPGNSEEKERIFMYPLWDAFLELGIQFETIDKHIAEGTIIATTDQTFRGRNLKSSYVIIDEAQDATISDLQLLTTRLHDSATCAIIGHSGQVDQVKPKLYGGLNAFQCYQRHLSSADFAMCCDLPINYRVKVSQFCDQIQETLDDIITNGISL